MCSVSVCLCIWFLWLCIWYLCILVFGYLCMRRKKKVVVRSRSLRTSESAPPSPLHASDFILPGTTTYFFHLLLSYLLFLVLITTYNMGRSGWCKGLIAQWNKLRTCQRSPAKGFTLTSLTKQGMLKLFFTFMRWKNVLLFNVRSRSAPTPHFWEVIRGWDWDLEAKLQSRAQGCK